MAAFFLLGLKVFMYVTRTELDPACQSAFLIKREKLSQALKEVRALLAFESCAGIPDEWILTLLPLAKMAAILADDIFK